MFRVFLVFAAIWTFAFPSSVKAQDLLDRVDPAQIEKRTRDVPAPAAAAPIVVEPPATVLPSANATVTVGAIELLGLKHLTRAHFSGVIEPYLGQTLTRAQLAVLTDELAERARATFPFASAAIEPQSMRAGILQVRIEEGRVDAVELEGFSNSAVLSGLQRLVTGAPVRSYTLENALLIAGDVDGVTIGETRLIREDGRNILRVKGKYRRFRAQLALDNDSTAPIGPLELYGSARFNGLFGQGDSMHIFALTAVPEVDELAFLRVRYAKRISPTGTEASIAGSFSRTMPGAFLRPLRIKGESRWASIGVTHPLRRSRSSSLWIDGSLSYRQVRQDRDGRLAREDRLTVAKLSLSGSAKFAGGVIRSAGTISQGLDIFDATRRNDPLSSRSDADGTYTGLLLSGQWTRQIAANLSVDVGVRSQLVSEPVLVSEDLGLGGATFARGYDYSERSGDKGTMAYAELRYRIDRKLGPVRGIELYAFADGGTVRDLGAGFGGGSLFSGGAGLRADVDRRTDASLEAALPLSGERYDTGNHAPRIRFSITRYF